MPVAKEKIIEGLNTSLDDCVPESEVDWYVNKIVYTKIVV